MRRRQIAWMLILIVDVGYVAWGWQSRPSS